jgi:hypothetical protein
MKFDSAIGKMYVRDWESDLNHIHRAGFSYGYIQTVDLATGEYFWHVDAKKEGGPHFVIERPALGEAVRELKRILLICGMM